MLSRILELYTKPINESFVKKSDAAFKYGVNERSIQRDIDDIKNHLENDAVKSGFVNSVVYDRTDKGYHLEQVYKMKLSNSEVLAES